MKRSKRLEKIIGKAYDADLSDAVLDAADGVADDESGTVRSSFFLDGVELGRRSVGKNVYWAECRKANVTFVFIGEGVSDVCNGLREKVRLLKKEREEEDGLGAPPFWRHVRPLLEILGRTPPTIKGGRVTVPNVDLPEGLISYLEPHPQGADRGGYLPCLETPSGHVVYWDCLECRWVAWDSSWPREGV